MTRLRWGGDRGARRIPTCHRGAHRCRAPAPLANDAGMSNYRRIYVPGGTYFFTVNLLERRRTLLVDRIDLLRDAFCVAREKLPFTLLAWVVMPDHLHCLWRLPAHDDANAERWRFIKTHFVRGIPVGERLSPRRRAKAERGIWQRRYWERIVYTDADLHAHVDYIHANPMKHGYVGRVCDCPHSSFHGYVGRGMLPIDWAGEVAGPMRDARGERGFEVSGGGS